MLWNNQPNCRNIDPFEKICLALKTRQKYTLRLEDIGTLMLKLIV